jgi:hypothetical protein
VAVVERRLVAEAECFRAAFFACFFSVMVSARSSRALEDVCGQYVRA